MNRYTYELNGNKYTFESETEPTEQDVLNYIKDNPQPVEQHETQQGMDLTPSGIVNAISDKGAELVSTPLLMLKNKTDWQTAKKIGKENQAKFDEKHKLSQGLTNGALDLAVYGSLPMLKAGQGANALAKASSYLGNAALMGGLPMGLESLKRGNGLLSGLGTGTGIGLTLPIPFKVGGAVIGKIPAVKKFITQSIGRIDPETINAAIQPNSKALDYNKDTARAALTDVTKNVRNNYAELLKQKGNVVGNLLNELPEEAIINKSDVLDDINNIYKNYSLSNNPNLNPAMNATRRELGQINELMDNTLYPDNLAPQELYDINKNIADMVKWGDSNAQTANDVLQQIYGANANRISDLSPALAQANKEYSKLMDLKGNDAVNQILRGDLLNEGKLGAAPTALKNYKSNITSGNKELNIKDLENILVDNGYSPFLNEIDDINAAMDLLKVDITGDSLLANAVRAGVRPFLQAARKANQLGLPQAVNNVKNVINPLAERLLMPIVDKSVAPMLYGQIEYNDR